MVGIAAEPPVRTATTRDGAALGYRNSGGLGIAVISPLGYGTTLAGLEAAFGQHAFLQALGSGHQVVTYDQRGSGASPVGPEPQNWEQRGADLWAVADAAGVERAVLYGVFDAGHTIAHAAAQQPDRVLGLVFNRVPAHFSGAPGETAGVATTEVTTWFGRDAAMPLGRPLQLMAAVGIGAQDAEDLIAAFLSAATPEGVAQQEQLLRAADLRPLLPGLRMPALVVAPRRRPQLQRWAEALAAALPAGRIVHPDNAGETLGAIHAFLTVVGADAGRLGSRLSPALSTTMSDSRRSVGALRRIVVPVDPNVTSGRAVELACRLGEAQKAEIVLVHVVAVPQVLPLDHPLPEATRRGERALTLGQVIAAEHGLSCRTRLLTERSVAGCIVRLARDEAADLIVMALPQALAPGEEQISRTAQEVLRRAPCEVIIDRGDRGDRGERGDRGSAR